MVISRFAAFGRRAAGMARIGLAIASFAFAAPPAGAEPAPTAPWLRAESAHFIVYCSCDAREIRSYAEKLEDFDDLLRSYHGVSPDAVTPRKLEVFMVARAEDLSRVFPGAPKSIGGFYSAHLSGTFAAGVRMGSAGDTIIFHEYTHHFMHQYFPYAYPTWLGEGYAEYFGHTIFTDTKIFVGVQAEDRQYELQSGAWLPISDLLTNDPLTLSEDDIQKFYAEAWLLTHYMLMDPARHKQLDTYVRAVAAGADPVKAMEEATGVPLSTLTARLHNYTELMHGVLPRKSHPASSISVTTLAAGAGNLMLDDELFSRPLDVEQKSAAMAEVRADADRAPGSRLSDLTLGKAELYLGDAAKADAMLDAFNRTHPDDADGLRLAALAKLNLGDADAARREGLYKAARPLLIRAYQLDPLSYQALSLYARSREIDADDPSPNTLKILAQAHAIAPQVDEISVQEGRAFIKLKRYGDAALILAPVAAEPHGDATTKQAKTLLKSLPASAAAAHAP